MASRLVNFLHRFAKARIPARVADWSIQIAVMLFVLGAIPLAFGWRSPQFVFWCQIGFVTSAIIGGLVTWRRRSPGWAFVRLRVRSDWRAVLLLSGCLFYFSAVLSPMPTRTNFNEVATGLIVGYWVCSAVRAIVGRRLELTEHGLFIRGLYFWEWDRIIGARWDGENPCRLTFDIIQAKKVSAVVPDDLRPLVESVLAERLPMGIEIAGTARAAEWASSPRKNVPSDARFGIRSLLILMLITAIVSALLGTLLRRYPAEARGEIVGWWLLLPVLLGGAMFICARLRRQVELQAGGVIVEAIPHSYFLPRYPGVMNGFLGAVAIALGLLLWGGLSVNASDPTGAGLHWPAIAVWMAIAIYLIAMGITFLWWHRRVRICERGIVARFYDRPWPTLRRYYWDACNRDVLVLHWPREGDDSGVMMWKVAVRIPPDRREEIDRMLAGVRSKNEPITRLASASLPAE